MGKVKGPSPVYRSQTARPLHASRSQPTARPTITVADRNDKLCYAFVKGLKPNGKPDKRFVKIGRKVVLSNGMTFVYAVRHNTWTLTRPDGSKRTYLGDHGVLAAWRHCPDIVAALGVK